MLMNGWRVESPAAAISADCLPPSVYAPRRFYDPFYDKSYDQFYNKTYYITPC